MKHEIEHKTKEPTPLEADLAKTILDLAKKKKPDKAKFAKARKQTAAQMEDPLYEYNRFYSLIDQLPIHYFHEYDQQVTGIVGEPGGDVWGGHTYPLVRDDGRVIRLPANRDLVSKIKQASAVGIHVTITYKGKQYYRKGGHYQKLYDLEVAPLPKEPDPAGVKDETPIAIDQKGARKIMEQAAARGDRFAQAYLARKGRKESK
jgi:hypothetical protein